MSVLVEMNSNAVGDMRALRMTLSRVPAIGEIVRVLATINGGTTEFVFKVVRVVHVANTDDYPKRPNELDAWIEGVTVSR